MHQHESSLPQPSSDAVLRFETAMGAEPLASHLAGIKNLVAAGTVPAVSMGTDPSTKGTVPMQVEGTDPMPQSGIVAENGVDMPILPKNPVSFENPVIVSTGTVPVSEGTVPLSKESDSVQATGTDPKQAVGTDPVTKPVVVKEREVSGRDVPVADEVPVVPNNRESYVASVVAPVKDVSVAPVREPVSGPVEQTAGTQTAGTDPRQSAGTDPTIKGTVPMQAEGTVPMPQAGVVAENSVDKTALARNPISLDNSVVEAKVVVPTGTGPASLGTDPVQAEGTDPRQTVGTDHVTRLAVAKDGGVSGREVPVAPKVPVAPNRESYVAPVVASANDVPVAQVREVEVGSVAEARLAPETAKPVANAKPEIKLESPPVVDKTEAAKAEDEVVALDAKQVQPLQAIPVAVAANSAGTVDAQSATAREVSAVSAASARTEAVVEVVDKLVEAVVSQITVTPSIVQGEGEVHMTLKANVLDGSDITLSAKGGELAVVVTPATPEAAQAIAVAAPRLEVALAEHVPTFRNVAVKLGSVSRKGNSDEAA